MEKMWVFHHKCLVTRDITIIKKFFLAIIQNLTWHVELEKITRTFSYILHDQGYSNPASIPILEST